MAWICGQYSPPFHTDDANLLPEWRGGPFETDLRYNFSGAFTGSWNGEDVSDLYRSPVEMGWGKSIALNHDFIGREGRAVSSDGSFDLKLTTPKELGGVGSPGANPEQLFAAGCKPAG